MELTKHPLFHLPSKAESQAFINAKGVEAFAAWCNKREESIRTMASDPFRHGHVAPIWNLVDDLLCEGKRVAIDFDSMYQGNFAYDYDYSWLPAGGARREPARANFPKEIITTGARELLIMGDNRSSKTETASKKFVSTLYEQPDRIGWALTTSSKVSIDVQQARIYKYLPAELKQIREKRSNGGRKTTKLGFSDADGFSNQVMVLPNRSKGRFLYYGMNVEDVEGNELDVVWADELCPLKWLSSIRTRLTDRAGILILTFTPVLGYTETVSEMMEGKVDLAEVPMRFFPGEKKPKLQRTNRGHVLYYHALHDNAFANRQAWLKEFGNKSRKQMRRRGEGIAEQAFGVAFPIFNRAVHVVDPSRIPAEGTRYHFCDPSAGKPWCNIYILVDPKGRRWIYREWPCPLMYVPGVGYIGDWAVSQPDMDENKQRADGYPGPGQDFLNWGVKRYAQEFERIESGEPVEGLVPLKGAHGGGEKEEIFERQMDSRAKTRKLDSSGDTGTSLQELCEEVDLYFEAASGKRIEDGNDLVSDWLYYDEQRPLEPFTNEPKTYISSECVNLIWALEHWTGKDGQNGACKDWPDLLRYAAEADPQYVPVRESKSYGGGFY